MVKKRLRLSCLSSSVLLCLGLMAMSAHAEPPTSSANKVAGVYAATKGSPTGRHARIKLVLRPDTTFQLEIAIIGNSRKVTRSMSGHWLTNGKKVLLERKSQRPIFTIEWAGSWTDETRHAAKRFAHKLAKRRAYDRCSFRSRLVKLEVSDLEEPIPQTKAQAQAALAKAKRAARAYEKAAATAVKNPGMVTYHRARQANFKAYTAWLLAKAGFMHLGLKVPENPR